MPDEIPTCANCGEPFEKGEMSHGFKSGPELGGLIVMFHDYGDCRRVALEGRSDWIAEGLDDA
jgi:hypothetical protein